MITISSDKSKLDVAFIHKFLTTSYWAKGRTIEQVKKTIENSFCYGVYLNNKQIGFARIVSDTVVFAYILDVFIVEEERGKTYATILMNHFLNDKKLKEVTQWFLKTKDAHKFYKRYGFRRIDNAGWYMEKINN